MRIKNTKTLETELSLDFTKDAIGIIVGDRDETKDNSLKLFIPRLMQGISIKDGKIQEEPSPIDKSILLNSACKNIGDSTIKLQNYLTVPPFLIPNMTLPRYVKYERILIKFMDNDIKTPYYAPYQPHDVVMRQTDITRLFTPAKENIDDPITNDNSYYIELNSRDKFVRLFTSNKNGEKCPFIFDVNTKDGIVLFKDDSEKRMFEWNYDEDKLLFQTNEGTKVEYKQAAITVECDTVDWTANESFKLKTSKFLLEADQGDFKIENMFVKNTSYEHQASNSKLKYDAAELSGNMWQIISQGLFLDAPATINTGMSVFAGFYVTKMAAPGKTPSVYAGGALDGTSPSGGGPPPAAAQPDSTAPSTKSAGGTSMTDMKGKGAGQPLAYAEPVISCLTTIAQQADLALGTAMFHMHVGEYMPLALNPNTPSVPKPNAASMKIAFPIVSASIPLIKAINFKA